MSMHSELLTLDESRERLIDQLEHLREGEDPTPYVEQFLPALLPMLRLGLRLGGRDRVVQALARPVGRMISNVVGPDITPALSRAIVDTGLKLISLEAQPEDEARLAASSVVTTVEETIRQVAAQPTYLLESPELLEASILEAFEQAASSYLPPILAEAVYRTRSDLHEGRDSGGTTWIGMPFRSRKRCYLKCPRIFSVRITPQMAEVIQTFGGGTLADYLQEQLGLPGGQTVEAELHLYEATDHTSVADLARHEEEVPGLGSSEEVSTAQLHPLTTQAAGLLLNDPSLGRETPSAALDDRRALVRGQRLYHLGVKGVRPLLIPGTVPKAKVRRASGIKNIELDFKTNQLKVYFFLGEMRAQRLAVQIRQQAHVGMLVQTVQKFLERGLLSIFSGMRPGKIRVLHGSLAPSQVRGLALQQLPPWAIQGLTKAVNGWLILALLETLKQHGQKVVDAAEDTADGLTFTFTVNQPPGFAQLAAAFQGKMLAPGSLGFGERKPEVRVKVTPGLRNE